MVNSSHRHWGKTYVKGKLNGLDCLAHILHNCLQHGIDTLDLDIQSVILKIYIYFSVHTVRTSHGDGERLASKVLASITKSLVKNVICLWERMQTILTGCGRLYT